MFEGWKVPGSWVWLKDGNGACTPNLVITAPALIANKACIKILEGPSTARKCNFPIKKSKTDWVPNWSPLVKYGLLNWNRLLFEYSWVSAKFFLNSFHLSGSTEWGHPTRHRLSSSPGLMMWEKSTARGCDSRFDLSATANKSSSGFSFTLQPTVCHGHVSHWIPRVTWDADKSTDVKECQTMSGDVEWCQEMSSDVNAKAMCDTIDLVQEPRPRSRSEKQVCYVITPSETYHKSQTWSVVQKRCDASCIMRYVW